jgi:hypothetical protein
MSTRPSRLALTLPIAFLIAACGSTPNSSAGSTQPSAPASGGTSAPTEAPASTSSSASLGAGQTDTDWGRIWDTVPAGFPRFPGSTPADDASAEPASARFAVPRGDPQAIATWFQEALETATFSTVGLNGPAEDGGFVLDSVGEGECRIETRIAPLGDTTFITVLYGADCPAAS